MGSSKREKYRILGSNSPKERKPSAFAVAFPWLKAMACRTDALRLETSRVPEAGSLTHGRRSVRWGPADLGHPCCPHASDGPILSSDLSRDRLGFVVGGPLADVDDDELGGLGGGNTDYANQSTVVEIVLRHGGAVAVDKEGFLLASSEELA